MMSRWCMWVGALAGIGHQLFYQDQLPQRIALHYGAGGRPDSWGDKTVHFWIFVGTYLAMALMFEGIIRLMAKLPYAFFNLPNKDYWLAPQRRDQTLRRLSSHITWGGVATMGFLIATAHASIQVNLGRTETLGPTFTAALTAYLMGIGIWALFLFLQFNQRPDQA